MPVKKPSRTVTFSAPPVYHAAIQAYCTANSISTSEMLRSIVHNFLSSEGFMPASSPIHIQQGRPKAPAAAQD
jgi:hypothetical protein